MESKEVYKQYTLSEPLSFYKKEKNKDPLLVSLLSGTKLISFTSNAVYKRYRSMVRAIKYYVVGDDSIIYYSNNRSCPFYVSTNRYYMKEEYMAYYKDGSGIITLSIGTLIELVEDNSKFSEPSIYRVLFGNLLDNGRLIKFGEGEVPFKNVEYFEYNSPIVTAGTEDTEDKDKKEFKLDNTKKYFGKDGIDSAILYLQNENLSSHIVRDDGNNLCVDLGSVVMWPDIDKVEWIMELNSRIPIISAVSVGRRYVKKEPHLCIVVNQNFI